RIRMVYPHLRTVISFAGNGTAAYAGDFGSALAASLNLPTGVSWTQGGDLTIAERGNHVVRIVSGASGVIETIAGNGTAGFSGDGGAATAAQLNEPRDAACDAAGNCYIADTVNHRVRMVAPDGIIST